MHSAAFNFDNFWDGRARFHFNGGSVFGPSDPFHHVFVDFQDTLQPMTHPVDPEVPLQRWFGGEEPVPVRIKFSSLASQAVGPPLSDFEMSFLGRSWAKIGKKLLQDGVTPLANQLVATDDSRLGRWSNQGGNRCVFLGRPTAPGKPGLCTTYPEMIQAAFRAPLWRNTTEHLNIAADADDPFDGVRLVIREDPAIPTDRRQLTQMEANFALFFGLAVQAYEELLIPDDTPFDQFLDANPLAGNGIGQPGEQGVLFPTLVPDLVGGFLTLIPDDPATLEYDGFGPDEVFGFDIFAGGNLTAALAPGQSVDPISGVDRNPDGFGSNPFTRTARCMLCHLGPEQTDHSINISHGLLKGDAEFEFPTPPEVIDPFGTTVPAPEPPGPIAAVGGLILAEEVAETAQDAVEVEPQNFAVVDAPGTDWDERIISAPDAFAFGDQGVYNIGVRPIAEDLGRGGDDPFGWPLSLAALTLKNIGGEDFDPCDGPSDVCDEAMGNFDPALGAAGGLFEESGDGAFFPGTTHTIQSINPGYERDPITPMLPEYLAEWVNGVPAGELHPQIDEMAGFAPNTITEPNGGPAIEFGENLFGSDLHCGDYNPALYGPADQPPNFGWGPRCPNNQSGVAGNILVDNIGLDLTVFTPGSLVAPLHGTYPMGNRVRRDGAFKVPHLRNVELTGPYFHTGSYLTLRQVVDFYMRGGDFPITNAEGRDQHMVDVEEQAFGFGTTRTESNGGPIPDVPFGDALPDAAFQYDPMPDTDHAVTPEPATSTPEAAKVALVRYLLSLTDQRVRYERAPFDRPEIFVALRGDARDNNFGREDFVRLDGTVRGGLLSRSLSVLPDGTLPNPMNVRRFLHIPAVGGDGKVFPLANFLGVSSTPIAGPDNDHFDR
jgi:hypothetical protein